MSDTPINHEHETRSTTQVIVHADAELLANAVAARLIVRIVDAQNARGFASIVLTGGGIGTKTLEAVAQSPARDAINWRALHVWWGDERFVPRDSEDRNERQARRALLDLVPLDPSTVHPMPSSDGPDHDASSAAARYARELVSHTRAGRLYPHFDVLMLGVGPDGHVASIFPEAPAAYDEASVAAVHGAPKPPATRITLTFPTIRSADEVWLLAAGQSKAAAVGMALSGAGPTQIPASGAVGGVRTLWLLDQPAAAHVPAVLRTPF